MKQREYCVHVEEREKERGIVESLHWVLTQKREKKIFDCWFNFQSFRTNFFQRADYKLDYISKKSE